MIRTMTLVTLTLLLLLLFSANLFLNLIDPKQLSVILILFAIHQALQWMSPWDHFEPYPFLEWPGRLPGRYLLRFDAWLVYFLGGPVIPYQTQGVWKLRVMCVFAMFLFPAKSAILVRASPRPFQVLMTMIIVCIRHIRPAQIRVIICAFEVEESTSR